MAEELNLKYVFIMIIVLILTVGLLFNNNSDVVKLYEEVNVLKNQTGLDANYSLVKSVSLNTGILTVNNCTMNFTKGVLVAGTC